MLSLLTTFPLSFWVVIVLLIGGSIWSWQHMRDAVGIPMLAVLFTVGVWYVGDAYYNDYAESYAKLFEAAVLRAAWAQVAWFLIVLLVATPWVHRLVNRPYLRGGSGVVRLFNHGVAQPAFQRELSVLFKGSVIIWATLVLIAAIRLGEELPFYFFPFLGHKAEPWSRARIGAGFDALLTLAFYFQLLVAGIFGVVAALATDRRTRYLAMAFCLLAWPYFIFDRTRNTMLAVVIPGVLSYGLLRVRGGIWKKAAVLALCFVLINAWLTFIIANRADMGVMAALKEKGFSLSNKEKTRHEGLNMFEELCWVNTFLAQGSYTPNWGARYFAEAVNIIPRSLWPGKPMIGIDYAIARGQGGGDASQAGVFASISTGMIGQGVVNFGRILGPAAAALLMSLWVATLARLDLQIQKIGRIPLYASGLILTFNLGRDITLITLYPFVFGALTLWFVRRFVQTEAKSPQPRMAMAPARSKANSTQPKPGARIRRTGFARPALGSAGLLPNRSRSK